MSAKNPKSRSLISKRQHLTQNSKLNRIWAQCVKELAQFRRDRLTVALAFLLPLLTLLIFGFAIRLETKNIPLAVQDFERSPLSRAYIERLFATNQLQPTPWSGSNPASALDQGIAKATVVIPPDFSRQIKAGKPSTVQVLVDGTDTNNARVIQNSIRATTNFFLSNTPSISQAQSSSGSRGQSEDSRNQPSLTREMGLNSGSQTQSSSGGIGLSSGNQTQSSQSSSTLISGSQDQSSSESSSPRSGSQTQPNPSSPSLGSGGQTRSGSGDISLSSSPRIAARTRIWFNPGRKESLYIVPGTFAVILWIYPSLLASLAMVREKEQGTILQVYASSLSAVELLLGKGLAYFLVGITEALLIMVLGSLLFGLWFAGDPTPLLVGTSVFLMASVFFGLFVGTRASDQTAAVQGVAFLGFMTALLLSGFIYPLSNIPFPLSLIANIVPARYYIEVTRDAFVRGTGWLGVWFSLLMIGLLGFLLFNAARRVLSRMQLPD